MQAKTKRSRQKEDVRASYLPYGLIICCEASTCRSGISTEKKKIIYKQKHFVKIHVLSNLGQCFQFCAIFLAFFPNSIMKSTLHEWYLLPILVSHETNKFEWTLNNIRIVKIISDLIWVCQSLFFEVSALLDVRHCPKLQSCAISRKINAATMRKWEKNLISGPILQPPLSPILMKKAFLLVLPLLVRHCSKVPSYAI